MIERAMLPLIGGRMHDEVATIRLSCMPCAVCGAAGPSPEVVCLAAGGAVAYCTVEHARERGWPWLVKTARGGSA